MPESVLANHPVAVRCVFRNEKKDPEGQNIPKEQGPCRVNRMDGKARWNAVGPLPLRIPKMHSPNQNCVSANYLNLKPTLIFFKEQTGHLKYAYITSKLRSHFEKQRKRRSREFHDRRDQILSREAKHLILSRVLVLDVTDA